jgi:hypothetical protein
MSMSLDRAVKIQNQSVTRLRDVFSTVRICRMPATDARERVQSVFNALPKSTPRHVIEFLRGYCTALQDSVWSDVEFCYRDASGTLFSTHRDSTHRKTEEFYASGKGCELGNLESAHVWKGTDKPYTPWSRMADHTASVKAA